MKKIDYVALEQDGQVMRLLPKKKKGILRLFFSRVGLVVLLILLQIGILLSAYRWFEEVFRCY